MRTQVSSEDAARIYKSAGGAYDQGDAVGVSVPVLLNNANQGADTAFQNLQAGLTLDSGIAERCKNTYSPNRRRWAHAHFASELPRASRSFVTMARVRASGHLTVQKYPARNPAFLGGWTRLLV